MARITLSVAAVLVVSATPTPPTSPTTANAFDRTFGGDTTIFWGDAFVARVDVDATAPTQPPPTPPPGRARRSSALPTRPHPDSR